MRDEEGSSQNSESELESRIARILTQSQTSLIKRMCDSLFRVILDENEALDFRIAACNAITGLNIPDPSVVEPLVKVAQPDCDLGLRIQALESLKWVLFRQSSDNPSIAETLLNALKDVEVEIRRQAAKTLGWTSLVRNGESKVVTALYEAIRNDSDATVRSWAIAALTFSPWTPETERVFIEATNDPVQSVAWGAQHYLEERESS